MIVRLCLTLLQQQLHIVNKSFLIAIFESSIHPLIYSFSSFTAIYSLSLLFLAAAIACPHSSLRSPPVYLYVRRVRIVNCANAESLLDLSSLERQSGRIRSYLVTHLVVHSHVSLFFATLYYSFALIEDIFEIYHLYVS